MSDGTQDHAASVVDGSEAGGGGYQTDFKRGKRYKKLVKLLSSKRAKVCIRTTTVAPALGWHASSRK